MRCSFRLALLLFASATGAVAQARIVLPTRGAVDARAEIRPQVVNVGDKPITFCVQLGQVSLLRPGSAYESTPIPFVVEAESAGRWRVLMIGPDIGSVRRPAVLQPGESDEFPFVVGTAGHLRLTLSYWIGSLPDLDCSRAPKNAKKAHSHEFVLAADRVAVEQ